MFPYHAWDCVDVNGLQRTCQNSLIKRKSPVQSSFTFTLTKQARRTDGLPASWKFDPVENVLAFRAFDTALGESRAHDTRCNMLYLTHRHTPAD